jgi:hypothetical protein
MSKKIQNKKFKNLIATLMDTWECDIDCQECPFQIKGKKAQKISYDATGNSGCGAMSIRDFAAIIYKQKHPKMTIEL